MPALVRRLHWIVLSGLLVVAVGCSQKPPPAPAPLTVTLVGETDLNGGGNAAVVRIYQLGGDAGFRQAPVQTFWQNDGAALGDELVTEREVILFPDATEAVDLPLDDRTQFVAFAADLREPDPDHWRAIFPVDEVRGQAVSVRVAENRLFVRVEPQRR